MSMFDSLRSRKWIESTVERFTKTFFQFYLGFWLFLNPDTNLGASEQMFDTLFTTGNLKAGVVGIALSLITSLGSSAVGKPDSPSLVDD
jgi:hypothetical protein